MQMLKMSEGEGSSLINIFWMLSAALLAALILQGVMGGFDERTDESPALKYGKPGRVTLVVFSDFQCPYCGGAADTIAALRREYGGRIDIVFLHYPLPSHEGARRAAQASECARDQGGFWAYHDLLFQSSASGIDIGDDENLKAMATNVRLDPQAFESCLLSGRKNATINEHIAEGQRAGVRGTPTFFFGRKMMEGTRDYDDLKSMIDARLS